VITRFLIAVNVLAYLWELSAGGPDSARVLYGAALVPTDVLQGDQWWRIITGAFLHAGLIHIGVNMLSLWFLGRAGFVAHAARLYGVAGGFGVGGRLL
jgi:rhomboid protease GluP